MCTRRRDGSPRRTMVAGHRGRRECRRSAAPVLAVLTVGVGLSAVLAALAAVATGGRAAAQVSPWVEPVVAPVVDGYRPPAHTGAPGNRGWEYATDPGTVVVAAGDGVVVFAGPIGGSRFVSIQHPDGRRTTYSHVDTIAVDVGDAVSAGAPIATSGERLHFGVRVGDEYRDPGELFGPTPGGPDGGAPSEGGLRLLPAAEGAAAPRIGSTGVFAPGRSTAPRFFGTSPPTDIARTSALGPWLASLQMPAAGAAGSARGWSGVARDTLAGGPQHAAVGP